jgi:hypothetical protein
VAPPVDFKGKQTNRRLLSLKVSGLWIVAMNYGALMVPIRLDEINPLK